MHYHLAGFLQLPKLAGSCRKKGQRIKFLASNGPENHTTEGKREETKEKTLEECEGKKRKKYWLCCGSILSLVYILFPFVLNSLSHITIPQNKEK